MSPSNNLSHTQSAPRRTPFCLPLPADSALPPPPIPRSAATAVLTAGVAAALRAADGGSSRLPASTVFVAAVHNLRQARRRAAPASGCCYLRSSSPPSCRDAALQDARHRIELGAAAVRELGSCSPLSVRHRSAPRIKLSHPSFPPLLNFLELWQRLCAIH